MSFRNLLAHAKEKKMLGRSRVWKVAQFGLVRQRVHIKKKENLFIIFFIIRQDNKLVKLAVPNVCSVFVCLFALQV